MTVPSPEETALRALANDENGADYGVLLALAGLVLQGKLIDADFQKVANAIVAQSVLFERLPTKKKGRPKDPNGGDGWSVAYRYFELVDSGARYADAVAQVAAKFHKDERHIMRLVKENKGLIGETLEDRNRQRKWWRLCAEMHAKALASGGEPPMAWMLKAFEEADSHAKERDLIAELDQVIDEVLDRRFH